MMKELIFCNEDKPIGYQLDTIVCDSKSVDRITLWYTVFHSDDDFTVSNKDIMDSEHSVIDELRNQLDSALHSVAVLELRNAERQTRIVELELEQLLKLNT
jgi:hypothetical protein